MTETWANRFTQFLDAEYGSTSSFGAEGLRALCFHPGVMTVLSYRLFLTCHAGGIPTELAQNLPKFMLVSKIIFPTALNRAD